MDGRSGHERLFGKQVHEAGLEFGDRILWRKHSSNDTNEVLDVQWAEEVWLGQLWEYNPSSYCCERRGSCSACCAKSTFGRMVSIVCWTHSSTSVEEPRHFSMKCHGWCCRLFQMSSQLQETSSARVCSKKSVHLELPVQLSEMCAVVSHTKQLVVSGTSEPWVTLETSVSQPPRWASQNLSRKRLPTEIAARKQVSALERATRSKVRRSALVSRLATSRVCRGNGTETIRTHHRHLQAHVHLTSDSEARPNFDVVLDERDAMIGCFCPDRSKTNEANETYELLLTPGADMSVARTTVAGLLSHQIFGAASVQHF